MTRVIPVILCGGSGTRLWPLSRSGFPKQFLVLSGDGSQQSLFQQAIERVNAISSSEIELSSTLIVTNEEHRFLALDQLRELKNINATLLLEPSGRNTAPALTLAALSAEEFCDAGDDPILVVTPADQTVQNTQSFIKAIQDAVAIAKQYAIAILGITPTSPEIGYGYIKTPLETSSNSDLGMIVERFVEKPNLLTAEQYLQEGGYFWNGGMFVLKASLWLAALKEFRPDIASTTEDAWKTKECDEAADALFIRPNKDVFNLILATDEHKPLN